MSNAARKRQLLAASTDIAVARARFLRLMIPSLYQNGFEELSAKYAVELGRLEARTPEQVAEEFGSCAREGHNGADRCTYCGVVL